MIKYPVTILLILLIGLQTFSKWCVILEYQVNKEFIAKNLCVNRAKPSCCCQGKCYLNKKMANDESQQQAPGKSGQREETPLQVFLQRDIVPTPQLKEISSMHCTRYIAATTQGHLFSTFQPPQA
ncbi:hypothetical protein Q4E93_31935 [Flavitalea sp. BT771]|uniref:hypothetical protein n=1 Tax=Flavitalea sp. BT771 TaxID=3063329 RepID=UPI0026E1E2A3|nr:hypothetical protein [Flavitalea sp. BT771]MDO6435271.1 hypothetical protein [Flavitalea sp. BT771]MDV6224024.1 hypothetical protein [Flavitalea sp. BT771]